MLLTDSYVAGLFDGEGYIRITKWKKPGSTHIRYALFGGIGMTHRPIIEALHQQYGGSTNENRHDLRSPRNRIQFTWVVSSQKAAAFLRIIHPFSIVKRDEIDIALELQRHIDSNPYVSGGRNHMEERPDREKIIAYRDDLFQKITALKKRSFASVLASGP
jgi:hypothetical protein